MHLATEASIRHEEHITFIRGLQRKNRRILRELRDSASRDKVVRRRDNPSA